MPLSLSWFIARFSRVLERARAVYRSKGQERRNRYRVAVRIAMREEEATIKRQVMRQVREFAIREMYVAENDLRLRVPVRTGRMKQGVKKEVTSAGMFVFSDVPYTPYVVRYKAALDKTLQNSIKRIYRGKARVNARWRKKRGRTARYTRFSYVFPVALFLSAEIGGKGKFKDTRIEYVINEP